MARIRSVHPDICTSETMADLEARYERTFVRLWTHCDDYGRCEDNSRLIRAAIYPLLDKMTLAEMEKDVEKLIELGLMFRYVVDGKSYLQISSWDEFQKPQHPHKPKLPAPPEASGEPHEVSGDSHEVSREVERVSVELVQSAPQERGTRSEEIGEGGGVIAPISSSRGTDPIWDALLSVCSIREPIPSSARGAYNKAAKELRDCGATPAEIHERANVYRFRFANAPITPSALVRHWGECLPTPDHLPRPKVNGNRATLARLAAAEAGHATA